MKFLISFLVPVLLGSSASEKSYFSPPGHHKLLVNHRNRFTKTNNLTRFLHGRFIEIYHMK